MGQGGDTHGHTFGLLGLGWTGGWEANSDDLVDGCEETELGWALEVPGEHQRGTVTHHHYLESPLHPNPSQSPKGTGVSQALPATPQGESLPDGSARNDGTHLYQHLRGRSRGLAG